jgi:hypothetical protein
MSHTAVAQHKQRTSAQAAQPAARLSGLEGYAVITRAEAAVKGAKVAAQTAKELADQICSLQDCESTDHLPSQDVILAQQLASMAAAAAQQAELGYELARSCYTASGRNGGAQHASLCTNSLADQDAAATPDQGTTDAGSADMTDLQVQHDHIKKYMGLLLQLLEDPAQLQQPDKAYIYSKMKDQGEAAELAWFDQHYSPSARIGKFLQAVCSSRDSFKSYQAGELLPHVGRSWRRLFRPWSAGQAEAAALQLDLQHELAGQRPMPANLKAETAKAHALRQLYVSYKMQSLLAAPSRYEQLKAIKFSWKQRQAGKAAWRERRLNLKMQSEAIRCKEAADAYLRAPAQACPTYPRAASYTSAQPGSSPPLVAKPAAGRWQQEMAKLAQQQGISAYEWHSFSAVASFDRSKSPVSNLNNSSSTQGLQASLRSASASAAFGSGPWSHFLAEEEPATSSQASSIATSQGSFSSFTTASTSSSGLPSDSRLQVWDLQGVEHYGNSLSCADDLATHLMVSGPNSSAVTLGKPAVNSLQVDTSSTPAAIYSSSRHDLAGIAGTTGCAKAGGVYIAALDPGLLAGTADFEAIFSLNIDDITPIDPSDDRLSGKPQGMQAEGTTAKAFVAEHSCTADLGPSLPHTVIHVAARLRSQRQSGEEGPAARDLEELPVLPCNQAEQEPQAASRQSSQSQQSTRTVLPEGTQPAPAPPADLLEKTATSSQVAEAGGGPTLFP